MILFTFKSGLGALAFIVAQPHPNLQSLHCVQMNRAPSGETFLDDLFKSFLSIVPWQSPLSKAHETKFFFWGGGEVGEIPCIRKLDTKFCYIGILYIC